MLVGLLEIPRLEQVLRHFDFAVLQIEQVFGGVLNDHPTEVPVRADSETYFVNDVYEVMIEKYWK